jgi:hypothetical protein
MPEIHLKKFGPTFSSRHPRPVPGIHDFLGDAKTWMAGTKPGHDG